MMVETVTKEEELSLSKGICPDCGDTRFLAGPSGGGSQNCKCAGCGAEFNICWPFSPERIIRKTKEILSSPAEKTVDIPIESRYDILDL